MGTRPDPKDAIREIDEILKIDLKAFIESKRQANARPATALSAEDELADELLKERVAELKKLREFLSFETLFQGSRKNRQSS